MGEWCRSRVSSLCQQMSRRKTCDDEDTQLQRRLGVFDLVFLGVGGMVGSGIYVLVGVAAKEQAGPGIVLSFLIAAVTIFLAAWCYTEFAARVSKTGSAYLFMYMSLGEFVAFLIGWASLFATINGAATNGRAWSAYLDSLLNQQITNFTEMYVARWHIGEPIAEYPDFVAASVVLILTTVVSLGVHCSAKFNAVFACLNVSILVFASIVGFIYADIGNWTSDGGFLPYGWSGVFNGAGACFWAFTGFEIISMSVEESKNPKRDIPISMVVSLTSVLLLYVCTSTSLTLVCSYKDIDSEAPLPSALANSGLPWVQVIVSVGPLCGLTTALFSSIYGFVRMAYAMSEDGLIFGVFSRVNGYTHVPVITTTVGGILIALQAAFFDLKNIISFGVVLSLIMYILVDLCVIILRYRPVEDTDSQWSEMNGNTRSDSLTNLLQQDSNDDSDTPSQDIGTLTQYSDGAVNNPPQNDVGTIRPDSPSQYSDSSLRPLCDNDSDTPSHGDVGSPRPAFRSWFPDCPQGRCVYVTMAISVICLCLLSLLIHYGGVLMRDGVWWAVTGLVFLLLVVFVLQFVVMAHTQNNKALVIKVPCIPWIPSLSIFTCLVIMVSTATTTSWVGVFIVFVLGVVVYFSYSITHSKLRISPTDGTAVRYQPVIDENEKEEIIFTSENTDGKPLL